MEYLTPPEPAQAWSSRRSPGSSLISSMLNPEAFKDIAPPEGVHWIGRQKGIFWDPHGVDAFAHSMSLADVVFQPGHRYLDFGCSSGRTVRTFAAAFPHSEWHGCDPVAPSIEWATAAMPKIDFRISPEAPPTDYLDAHFAGVYAVSVWTHFAEDLALAWLDEMHRIVAPGGFLVFSAAGSARLAHGMQGASPEQVQKITLVWHRLIRNGFVFFPTYANEQHHGLDTSRWGLTRMTPEWVISKIIPKWALLAFDPGRYGPLQDIYVLQRR